MQRKMFWVFLVCLFRPAFLAAATIVVSPNPPVAETLISDPVTGADMAGLIMRATYATPGGPTVVTATWAATGPTSGAASAFFFPFDFPVVSVSLTGDTGASLAWRYTASFLSPLLSLELDGASAGIYFDRTSPNPGTPGSGPGADLAFGPLLPPGIIVTYSSVVSLGANPPQNDLYATLRIDFGGGLDPQDFTFTQDTDRNAVPEPASGVLALAGLASLCIVCRERFRGGPHRGGSP